MLYEAFQIQEDALVSMRWFADAANGFLKQPWPLLANHPLMRNAAAACEMVSHAGMWHHRPEFGIHDTEVDGRLVPIVEEVAFKSPFCELLHFRKDVPVDQPRVLLVAPLSGHFATLLRGTVETLLPDHDVFITDWANARNVPLLHGRFGLDDYIDLIIEFVRYLGPETHIIAVCQPAVPVFAAVSILSADEPHVAPRSMTLMGGPIDTRANPTAVNNLATSRPLSWFEHHVIAGVPARFPGAFRCVYPGFLQLAGFMTMNLDRHVTAHVDMFRHLVRGDGESAAATRKFYNEYMSVMDLPADFYLQTVERVFQRHDLPLGRFMSRDRKIEPAAISRTALMTIEGENDDICAVGQTGAAHVLCSGLADDKKAHHVQPQVGHYGVFNGKRWRTEIYPKLRDFIRENG